MNKSYVGGEGYFENKILCNSRYDYNYCNATNHLARDCMLKKINEKKENQR